MTRDMTTGTPLARILAFCAPLLVGNLFQQFYNLADSIIVGRLLGVNAFAAVGSTGALNFLVLGFALGMGCQGFWYGDALAGFMPMVIGLCYYLSQKWRTVR